jgi:hypothetical protein
MGSPGTNKTGPKFLSSRNAPQRILASMRAGNIRAIRPLASIGAAFFALGPIASPGITVAGLLARRPIPRPVHRSTKVSYSRSALPLAERLF